MKLQMNDKCSQTEAITGHQNILMTWPRRFGLPFYQPTTINHPVI